MRQAKHKYKQKVELKVAGGNLGDTWKGLKNMAAVKTITDQFISTSGGRG